MSNRLKFSRDLNIYKPVVKKVLNPHETELIERFFKIGDRVIFDPICTCEGCKMVERWYLKRGNVFTVKDIVKKDGWETIELEEIPEKFFASMMFVIDLREN